MLKYVAIVIVALAAAWLAYAATRPDTFRFERSIVIDAKPAAVFTLVSDFREWRAWSPWEGLDPELQRHYSGAERGEDAVYAWEGNRNVGAGRMEITEAIAASRITIKLDFLRPIEAHQFTEFVFTPEASGGRDATRVTWAMHGPTPFLWKLLGPFFDFERVIGSMLETGLASLKEVAEAAGAKSARPVPESDSEIDQGSI